jgi:hypothetical protein
VGGRCERVGSPYLNSCSYELSRRNASFARTHTRRSAARGGRGC